MSSAILYLAIVAIWACILVPRWVRRPHPVVQESPVPVTVDDDLAAGAAGGDAVAAAVSMMSAVSLSGTLDDRLAEFPAESAGQQPESAESVSEQAAARSVSARSVSVQTATARSASARSGSAEAASVRPPVSRSAILQARRRMMTTLVTLAIAAFTFTTVSLTPWWICVPPAGMLGMYLFLLREAARADAELYQRRQEAARMRAARQRAREAWAARVPGPQPTAQIIDISGRVGDQLYDQYADATMRAVGD